MRGISKAQRQFMAPHFRQRGSTALPALSLPGQGVCSAEFDDMSMNSKSDSSPALLSLPGAPALSPFRRDRLLKEMQARVPGLTGMTALYWHFAALDGELDARGRALLERLLTYGPAADAAHANPLTSPLLVIPRLGTISPWSTKATDIAHCCGLKQIRRIERGVAWHFTKSDGSALRRRRARGAHAADPRPHGGKRFAGPDAGRRAVPRRCPRAAARGGSRRGRARGAGCRQPRMGAGAVGGRDRLSGRELQAHPAQSHRRRAHDVRAGQLRALPPQDFQRRLDHRRQAAGPIRCSA